MLGLMQHHQLLISSILDHAARHHGQGEIVSRRDDGALSRTTYAVLARRARSLAAVLRTLGVRPGDRVGTMAMNSDRHFELYYAITGIGAVCNTINPRLAPDDIAYIVSHAQDGLIFVDPAFFPIVLAIAPKLADVLRGVVVMTDAVSMPRGAPGVALYCYESLMEAAGEGEDLPIEDWPVFDENCASNLCY
ncbi:MAG TPA: AMP-binding protein, partial [Dongiaceae bacterium]|nr:AMP-binding protein [Dongiaceae bacterium]